MQKFSFLCALSCFTLVCLATKTAAGISTDSSLCTQNCYNGVCDQGVCVCYEGWQGELCQYCDGKIKFTEASGHISSNIVGNYSANARCSWLIESKPKSSIRFRIDEFETENSWDHLYIYDGDSIRAPLLATLSSAVNKSREIITSTNTAFLHFSSDVALNFKGFNISYASVDPCSSKNQSLEHSVKNEKRQSCPNDCFEQMGQGKCNFATGQCQCATKYTGQDCNERKEHEYCINLDNLPNGITKPKTSAGHCAIVWKNFLYVIGGFSFQEQPFVSVFDFNTDETLPTTPHFEEEPLPRYGHSCVLHKNKIFMYGGTIINSTETNELWTYDLEQDVPVWRRIENLKVHSNSFNNMTTEPIKVTGHTAHLIMTKSNEAKMLVIFGYSSEFGLLNVIQEYDLETQKWQLLKTFGVSPKVTYGHSSAYDESRNQIFLFGGYSTKGHSVFQEGYATQNFYVYDTISYRWSVENNYIGSEKLSDDTNRYLHSMVFLDNDHLLVFGGKTSKQVSLQERGFTAMIFNKEYNQWYKLSTPDETDFIRYGHSTSVYNETVYIYGGFNGQMVTNILKLNFESYINQLKYINKNARITEMHPQNPDEDCTNLKNCQSCLLNPSCNYSSFINIVVSKDVCKPITPAALSKTTSASLEEPTVCETPCSESTSCGSCTESGSCIWCQSEQKCITKMSFPISFPYGQCRDWTTRESDCLPQKSKNEWCNVHRDCKTCRRDPACGWCDDGSGSGTGKCLHGGAYQSTSESCPSNRWYFTECPDCQCNGHSACSSNISECIQPCKDFAQGLHCETCQPGYFGNPVNGGTCEPCNCNGYGSDCDNKSGKCLCSTKGVAGDHCEKCDPQFNFNGVNNPLTGVCYYYLETGFEFTFNMSRKEDAHYTAINFQAAPQASEYNIYFTMYCSNEARVNMTLKQVDDSEKPFLTNIKCDTSTFKYIMENNTVGVQKIFYVHAFDLKPPLILKISFAQLKPRNKESVNKIL